MNLPPLSQVIAAHGLATKKSLGQHFLLDSRLTDKIALYAGDLADCNVIEIGPGPGGLTRSLLNSNANTVTVIEKDERCIAIMQELQAVYGERLRIIPGDAMEIDLQTIPAPRKIVANLPYNVGTQLLLNWLDDIYKNPSAYQSLTLMFQKEVGMRIIAGPDTSEYGRLSVISQFLCDCRYDFELPPGAFSPPPKVSSAVITLIPRAQPLAPVSKSALEKVVAAAFGQRRKMLRGSLKSLGMDVEELLSKSGIDGTLRAEVLDVSTFCTLAQSFERMQKKINP